ncbi:DUF1501 domain-containing protein [Jiulongibacter sediminis]|nr:DUF1501 domain-containing protein [Jiulongibacter sediminis]
MNRRDFIRNVGCGAMGSTTLLSTLANLGVVNGAMANKSFHNAPPDDYKAIVCVLLAGGMDSYNMLIPNGTGSGGDNGFANYQTVRGGLALQDVNALHNLNILEHVGVRGVTNAYDSFAVHTQMPELQQLFDAGNLAFMSNIGTLVEPLANEADYDNDLKKKPLGIYSHSDQIQQWQTSVPQSRDSLGFGGRIADLLHAGNDNVNLSMNISLGGKNIFQRGKEVSEYAIRNNINANNVGFEGLPGGWSNSGYMTQLRNQAVDNLVAETYRNALHTAYGVNTQSSIAAFETFKKALLKVPSFTTSFPQTGLAEDLFAVSRVMSIRNELGVKRQIFFVTYGGWDMHDNLIASLNGRLPVVSQALKAFYDSTVELGIADKVTTITISDFGRTLTSNGTGTQQGSDHAWGGNSIVMGGSVNGRKIYGGYPQMEIETNARNISNRGNFIPAVSTDELYAELALWYGVSPSDLCYALPNIGNFYSYSAGNYPLGLMNMSGGISTVDQPQNCLTY